MVIFRLFSYIIGIFLRSNNPIIKYIELINWQCRLNTKKQEIKEEKRKKRVEFDYFYGMCCCIFAGYFSSPAVCECLYQNDKSESNGYSGFTVVEMQMHKAGAQHTALTFGR